jgi:hypothetical protein
MIQAIPPPWNIEPLDVQIKQIIITRLLRRGEGKNDDPIRIITQFWDMDGNLIAEFDPSPTTAERSAGK